MRRRQVFWLGGILFCEMAVNCHAFSVQVEGLDTTKSVVSKPTSTPAVVNRRRALVGIVGAASLASLAKVSPPPPTPLVGPLAIEPLVEENSPAAIPPSKLQNDEGPLVSLIAGSALTASSTLAKYPLDTATVRLQMPDADPKDLFKDCWKGVTKPLLANIPAGAVFFAIKDSSTHALIHDAGITPLLATLIGLGLAQIPNWIVLNPSEVSKTQTQAGVANVTPRFSSLDEWRRFYYHGFWKNVMYNYPYDICKFLMYDLLMSSASEHPDALHGAIFGAMASVMAQVLTTPLDVLRNRAMAFGADDKEEKPYYKLVWELCLDGSMFAGVSPRVGKAIISGSVQFAAFEQTKELVSHLLAGIQ